MTDEMRFPPRLVCAALNIPAGTLATWANRGMLRNFDAAHTTPGKARMFTMRDALALALLKAGDVTEYVELPDYAPTAARDWMKHRPYLRELHIRYSDKTTSIRYNDDIMESPPPSDWQRGWSYNLDDIFGQAEERLLAFAPESADAIAAEEAREAAEPLLPTIKKVRT